MEVDRALPTAHRYLATLPAAVIAQNFNALILEVRRHRVGRDLLFQLGICMRHVSEALEAERTLVVKLAELGEAPLVHGVAALGQQHRLLLSLCAPRYLGRVQHVLHANRAVGVEEVRNALVLALEVRGKTAVARGTVEEVFAPTLATDAAGLAVELLLGDVVVEQVALRAEIFAELEAAALALLVHLRKITQGELPFAPDCRTCT